MPWLRSLLVLLLIQAAATAADWPQWLGPHRDGSTPETIAPWQGKLKLLWKQPVGEGHSSPVVADDVVYLHTKAPNANAEVVQAFAAADGKPLWKRSYPRAAYKGLFGNGPRATPAVVDGRIYTYGITGVLSCFNSKNGEPVWQINTQEKFDAPKLFFGASCSPLVHDGRVLMNIGGKGSSLMAFAADSGKVLWQKLDDGASYASPILIGKGATAQAVFLTQAGLDVVAPDDGALLWRYPFKDALAESSTTPVYFRDLVLASSITRGTAAVKAEGSGKKQTVSLAWRNPDLTCYFATPVPVDKHIYMVTGTKPPALVSRATLHCVDPATGKSLWSRPNVGQYHASLIRTGDNKLLMLEEKGDLVLLDPNPKGYRELARASVCGKTWAHAAISHGRLYIRDEHELRCLELPKGEQ